MNQVTNDARMVDGQGRTVLPDNEQHAAWLAVEDGARPLDPDTFPWDRVLTLAGSRTINERAWEPGSAL